MQDLGPTFSTLTAMFQKTLGEKINQQAVDFADLFAEDGVMEFPYALEFRPKRVSGITALRAYLQDLHARFEVLHHSVPVVHWTLDPSIVIVEFSVQGRMREGGAPHDQVYIDVLTLEEGKIKNFRDYWNPTLTASYRAQR